MGRLKAELIVALDIGGEEDAGQNLERAVQELLLKGAADVVTLRTLKRVCRQLNAARQLLASQDIAEGAAAEPARMSR